MRIIMLKSVWANSVYLDFFRYVVNGDDGSSLCAMLRQCFGVSYFLAHFLDGGVTQVDNFFVMVMGRESLHCS